MYSREEVTLRREVQGVQIPDGTRFVLTEGTPVEITQQLGGSYTVMTDRGAMVRIDSADADALGKESEIPAEAEADGTLEERVWAGLRKCYDPEIPCNIVELGLVYDCTIEERQDGAHRVAIKMTLTAPGCGMGPVLADDVRRKIEQLPEVEEAAIEVVFDPPWNPNMMTEAARLQLGFM